MQNKNNYLIDVYNRRKLEENMVAEKNQDPETISYYVPPLEGTNVVYALYALYIEQDKEKAKLLFHNAACIAEFASNKFNRRIMDTGIFQISYALLSDDTELINRYSLLRNPINNETSIGFQMPNSMQNILLGDTDKLDWNIHFLKKFVNVPKFKWYSGVIPILNGFKANDAELIKQGLNELADTHKKRNKEPLIPEFISLDTTGFNKLAWLKGYEIEIESEFVPQELIPIKPLKEYPTYRFLKS